MTPAEPVWEPKAFLLRRQKKHALLVLTFTKNYSNDA